MPLWLTALTFVSLAAWLWLTLIHGRGFWRGRERLPATAPKPPAVPPGVVAVVPARDEAAVIGRSVESLLRQDWPVSFPVIVVDDHSTDGTADAARAAAARVTGGAERLHVIPAPALEPGWTGKLWAQAAGLARAKDVAPTAALVWLADADIAHGPTVLCRLHDQLTQGDRVMASVMARLDTGGRWARLLIPAFIYFFQKLYPFPRVNDPADAMAAAAGGCVLARRDALEAAGVPRAIRAEIIDDCALGRALKRQGPVWLGTSADVVSLRPAAGLGDIWHMVTRTAFEQLHHSAALLAGTVVGMALLYLLPPLAFASGLATGDALTTVAGGAAWLLMAGTLVPTLRLYGLGAWRGLLLPVAGVLYTLMTLDSARRHWRGQGGAWKGRVQGGRGSQAR
ncbi:Glycosyl transferase, family 2 [Caenispirillum salinarum AK4]|uniref:Glycosyl transferase, family 2 n=1 Tax=Caenispirillum salinarum AK4 TaxID=1238182 RepID=K9H099_9PROT|nr:glycosyltransferase [Caenispirillum salinarum]EKV31620.1 Glycosyl transferase, family 2 [Caenispirillum salinarum AK4]